MILYSDLRNLDTKTPLEQVILKGCCRSHIDTILYQLLLPLDKTIVFHFYDFVLVLSAVSSRCQLYSVGLSQRKLIPNSALFILPFREFYA